MGQPKFHLRRFNKYSWSIIAAFIFAAFAMQYRMDVSMMSRLTELEARHKLALVAA